VNKDVTLNVRKGKYCETTKQQHSKNNNDNDRNQNKFIHLISKEEYLAPFYISVCIAIPFIILKDILIIDNPEGTLNIFELLCLYFLKPVSQLI
jgi:hypothetical protein